MYDRVYYLHTYIFAASLRVYSNKYDTMHLAKVSVLYMRKSQPNIFRCLGWLLDFITNNYIFL